MGFSKNSMILVFLMAFCGSCFGAVYKVGDSQGWTNKGNVDYKTWASTKQFHVGDVINFVYDPQEHNVVRVKHKDFKTCNGSNSTFVSHAGNDVIVIKKPGHLYFICSVPGHCQAGQKVDIRVPPNSGIPSATHTPSPPSPTASPPSIAPTSPTPSIKGAPTSKPTISSPPSPTASPPSIAPASPTPSINAAPHPKSTISSSPAPTPSNKKKSAAPSLHSSKMDLLLLMAVLVVAILA